MKFHLRIDPTAEEEVLATVHRRTEFTDRLEALVLGGERANRIIGYREDDWRELRLDEVECIFVQEEKTFAIDAQGDRYWLKVRLYEVEKRLPDCFFRINKSAIANRDRIERFTAAFNGAVDVKFKCGYQDYVSRRCFRAIKERMGIK